MFIKKINKKYDAKADIYGSSLYKQLKGVVYFKNWKKGVLVTAEVDGLPNTKKLCDGNVFGFHIHDGDSCSGNKEDEFANSGMHYNPKNCLHPFHAGDLPPLFENDGYAYMSFYTNRFTIAEIIGKTIVIHSNPDDFTSQPSGNSGRKIACGVIKNN